jgi:hypothetical protein
MLQHLVPGKTERKENAMATAKKGGKKAPAKKAAAKKAPAKKGGAKKR